jgi:hypothetical protein
MDTDQYNEKTLLYLNTIDSNSNNPVNKLSNEYLSNIQTMYDNKGKFFDNRLFNQRFDNYIKEQQQKRITDQDVKLHDLNSITNLETEPYKLPLYKILFNIQIMWFNIFDNIVNYKNPFENFNQNDIFYLGVSIIILVLLYLFLYIIFVS